MLVHSYAHSSSTSHMQKGKDWNGKNLKKKRAAAEENRGKGTEVHTIILFWSGFALTIRGHNILS